MPIDKQYMKKVDELLKQAGRLDLWRYAFEKDKPESPVDLVNQLYLEHPEKRKRVNPYQKYADEAKKRAEDWYHSLSENEKSFLTVKDYPGV